MTNTPAPAPPQVLSANECWALLRSVSVGRLALWVTDHPDIFPINYAVDHGSLVFRTGVGAKRDAALSGTPVAMEADGVDPSSGVAWSVVVKGAAALVESTEEVLDTFSINLFPWQAGRKDSFIRVTPTSVTGRKFTVVAPAHWWTDQATAPHTASE